MEALGAITIPLFSGAIGYLTNWSGIWMLFQPLRFKGVRIPGLATLAGVLPRKIQEIPGIMHGGVGWQGIIPSRAAKMGSIAVDKGIAKLGSPSDFYEQLDPELIAEHIVASSQDDLHELVERTMEREHPALWRDLPPRVRAGIHERVQRQLPDIVRDITRQIGENINQLLDVKLMVIRHMDERPELCNRIFTEVGARELRFIINFGFFFGFVLGIPVIFLTQALPYWWVLPIAGTIIGYATNWLAISMIFEPIEPRKVGRFSWQGLFLKRQKAASEVYAHIIADEIVTVANIGEELMHGPRSDRTRAMIQAALRPAIDRAVPARDAVRVAVGTREYDAIRESVATEGVEYTIAPLTDPEFNRVQAEGMRDLLASRMRDLPSADFAELLRSAMHEDEWLLVLHGAVLGFAAGCLHLAIFGVG